MFDSLNPKGTIATQGRIKDAAVTTSERTIALPWDMGISCLVVVSAGVDVAIKQSSHQCASTPVRVAPAKALADLGK